MSTSSIPSQIEEMEGFIESQRQEMVPARENWLEAAGSFLAGYWLETAREVVKKNPEVVERDLGAAGVKALRKQVEEMAERSGDIAQAHLFQNHRDLWPDQMSLSDLLNTDRLGSTFNYYSHGEATRPANFISDVFSQAAALVADLLKGNGFSLKRRFEHGWDEATGKSVVRVRSLEWSKEMGEAINVYADQTTDLFEAVRKLKKLNRQKDEKEAVDLWDQAG